MPTSVVSISQDELRARLGIPFDFAISFGTDRAFIADRSGVNLADGETVEDILNSAWESYSMARATLDEDE